MKYALIVMSCFVLALTSYASVSRADSLVAAVDVRKLIETSSAGKSIQVALKAKRDVLQKEANAFEKKMRDQEQALIQERKTIKPEDFEVKKKAFEENFVKTRQSIVKKTTDLDNQRKAALRKLQEQIAKATADIADEKKIKIVVDRELVVIVDQTLDLTDEVLKKVDERVKSIPLE